MCDIVYTYCVLTNGTIGAASLRIVFLTKNLYSEYLMKMYNLIRI